MQPFRKLISTRVYLLSFFEAALVAACCVAAAFICLPYDASIYLLYEGGASRIALVSAIFLVTSYLFDFYKQSHVGLRLELAQQLAELIGITLVVQAAFGFAYRDLVLPQAIIIVATALMLVTLLLWRVFVRPIVWNAFGAQQVIFVGANTAVHELTEEFRTQPTRGMQVAGYVIEPGTDAPPGAVLGGFRELPQIVSKIKPDRIIVGADRLTDKGLLKALFELKSAGYMVETAGHAYEALFGRIYSRGLEPYTVIFRDDLSARPTSLALQSIYTNLLALASLIVTVPVMIVVAIAMKATRKGPVLAKYTCVGLHGIPFEMYRFRCTSARRDYVSRFLLRFKLEGLPQALNIVRGEMALIGPRAERIEYDQILRELIPFYRYRQHVKPGLTGWSQLHCDPSPTEDTLARIEHDLYYVKHISLVLDAYILVRALKWVLSDRPRPRSASLDSAL